MSIYVRLDYARNLQQRVQSFWAVIRQNQGVNRITAATANTFTPRRPHKYAR